MLGRVLSDCSSRFETWSLKNHGLARNLKVVREDCIIWLSDSTLHGISSHNSLASRIPHWSLLRVNARSKTTNECASWIIHEDP